jgi:hypothetical protein
MSLELKHVLTEESVEELLSRRQRWIWKDNTEIPEKEFVIVAGG